MHARVNYEKGLLRCVQREAQLLLRQPIVLRCLE